MNIHKRDLREKITVLLQALSDKRMEEAVEYIEYLYNKELNEEKSSEKLAGELQNLSEGDLSNYLQQLENYEDLLARGKILWK